MFSGSAVVDVNNTSGLGTPEKPPLVLIYTAAGDPTTQCIASSTDGRHFTKYAGNPVLPQITPGNRDPKVLWHAPTERWVMALYVGLPGDRHTIHFFSSSNLIDWTLESSTEGIPGTNYLFECPDFFELPVDGAETIRKWVLFGANSEYAIGSFDGKTFLPEATRLPGHRGRGFYAAQTFSDIPPEQHGRRILMGWFQTETKGMPFNQSMTVPLNLNLVSTEDGPRLTFRPVPELETLRRATFDVAPLTLEPASANPLAALEDELLELQATFAPGTATEVRFVLRGAVIVYDRQAGTLSVNDHAISVALRGGTLTLQVYLDRTGLEVFVNDGLMYIPLPFQPEPTNRTLSLSVVGGEVSFPTLKVYSLSSAWTPSA
jgi:sucrose-6-phosphate hydrolase SacC (GH32 family)